MKTAILTDTNSGISVEEGRARGIYVLSMPVLIGENSYMEGVDVTHAQLYQAFREKKTISSSQPSPGDVMEMWDRILAEGWDEIVHIPMSSELSGTCANARQMALGYKGRVQVADNHRISVSQMEAAFEARSLADAGMNAVQIREYLEKTAYQASIYITVESLEHLKKSGRVTPSAAAIASVLNIKPILSIQGGKLDAHAKVRGQKQSEKKMIEALRADLETRFKGVPRECLRLATAGTIEDEAEAVAWRDMVSAAFPGLQAYYRPLPCSIACHVGPGSRGIGVTVSGHHIK